jgi:cytochrome c556
MSPLASAAGKSKDVAAYKASFPKLSATCKACHDIYRKKKA